MDYKKLNAIIYAVLVALFYAINIPCSKLLLNNVAPTFMAAFLYLGAGLGVGIMYVFHAKKESWDERIGREDIPYTLAMVVLDIIAPILLMIGVKLGEEMVLNAEISFEEMESKGIRSGKLTADGEIRRLFLNK